MINDLRFATFAALYLKAIYVISFRFLLSEGDCVLYGRSLLNKQICLFIYPYQVFSNTYYTVHEIQRIPHFWLFAFIFPTPL